MKMGFQGCVLFHPGVGRGYCVVLLSLLVCRGFSGGVGWGVCPVGAQCFSGVLCVYL